MKLEEAVKEKKEKCISNNVDKIDVTFHKVVPKGAKMFYFDKDGNELPITSNEVIDEVAYSCIALSRQRAINKFNKFNKQNK